MEGQQVVSARAKTQVPRLSSVLSVAPHCPMVLVLAAAGWPKMTTDKGL